MKNPEIHTAVMGRLMCFTAVLESGCVTAKSGLLPTILAALSTIYKPHEFLRESIQVALKKILTQVSPKAATFDTIVDRFLLFKDSNEKENEKGKKSSTDEKEVLSRALLESSSLSMFLMLRHVYLSKGSADKISEKYQQLMEMDVLAVGNQKV